MGMYTELIFGASLKKNTPKEVIDVLKYMIGDIKEKPIDFPFSGNRSLFLSGSYYFGVCDPVKKLWFDTIDNSYKISTRSNLKNYNNEIETFLEWIKPYIESGSGSNNMYAIVTYEEDYEPTIYYLNKNEN